MECWRIGVNKKGAIGSNLISKSIEAVGVLSLAMVPVVSFASGLLVFLKYLPFRSEAFRHIERTGSIILPTDITGSVYYRLFH